MRKKEENDELRVRQIILVSLNESVTLVSSYSEESMNFLTEKALELMDKIQKKEERKHD